MTPVSDIKTLNKKLEKNSCFHLVLWMNSICCLSKLFTTSVTGNLTYPWICVSSFPICLRTFIENVIMQNEESQNNDENVNNIKKKLKAANILSYKTKLD